jgi:6-pyruvoyltetrahydropterin/6-carboxytetrahydropterin synthase
MIPAPPGPRRRLFVAKDEHKFSCAHMTLFPDGTKERLHGHNYRVAVAVDFEGEQGFLDFARVKAVLAQLCGELREHLLMPTDSPAVRVLHRDELSTEMLVCDKRYVIPSDEVFWLPVENVVVESLAEYLWGRMADELHADMVAAGVDMLEVTVTEAPGQGASHRCAPRGGR